MTSETIEKIISLSRPVTIEENNEKFSTVKLERIQKELRANALSVATLSSIVQYIKNFKENLKPVPLLVHVTGPRSVELISALDGDRKREVLMTAEAETPNVPFGRFIGNEEMLITVQSMFVDDQETDRAAVLKFAGTVTDGSIKEYGDDGVTQKATIQQGIASKAEAIVPSPCVLRPYRTFPEVEQPASKFIFRMREGAHTIESALFEADGGAWRNEARKNIHAYLEEQLEGTGVTVIS